MDTQNSFSPRDIRDVIENKDKKFFDASDVHDVSDINPRYGKKSFFFGGEFEIPLAENGKVLYMEELAKAACKSTVQCAIEHTYWWPVYKHSGEHDVLSIHTHSKDARSSSRSGVILIKKSDTVGLTDGQVARMIERELSDYSIWLNKPMSVQFYILITLMFQLPSILMLGIFMLDALPMNVTS